MESRGRERVYGENKCAWSITNRPVRGRKKTKREGEENRRTVVRLVVNLAWPLLLLRNTGLERN